MELPPYVPKVQGDFLVHAVGILIADARIIGIGAGGSFVSGEMDDYSDVDLLVVVSDPSLCTDIAARIEIASRLGLLLTCFTGIHVGDLRLLICVYGPPVLKVDLKFVTADDLKHRVEDPVVLYDPISVFAKAFHCNGPVYPSPNLQWIEDAFWAWILSGGAKIRRGELFEAKAILNFLVEKVLAPLLALEYGHQPSGVRRIEFRAPPHLTTEMPSKRHFWQPHASTGLSAKTFSFVARQNDKLWITWRPPEAGWKTAIPRTCQNLH